MAGERPVGRLTEAEAHAIGRLVGQAGGVLQSILRELGELSRFALYVEEKANQCMDLVDELGSIAHARVMEDGAGGDDGD